MQSANTPPVDSDYIINLRHELHRFPELGFDLPRTLEIVRRELENLHIPYTDKFGTSSLVALINPDSTGFSIGIRADMDALPLTEKTNLPFSSEHAGIMHACGHDAHTAMLLGTARALKQIEHDLTCKVVLIFQACEEGCADGPGGAQRMVQDGLMDEVDMIIGLHVENWLEHGTVGVAQGPSMASAHSLHLEFFGKTAHATLPQSGVNALAMAVNTYTGIQNMMTTRLNPLDRFVLSVGQLEAGRTDNVIPDYAHMRISLRTYEAELTSIIVQNVEKIAENAAAEQGGQMRLTHRTLALPLINDNKIAARVRAAAEKVVGGQRIVTMPAKLSSEDFSFYLEHKPGVFFRLGTRNEASGCVTLPHNNDFLIDESALAVGSQVCVQFVIDNQKGLSN